MNTRLSRSIDPLWNGFKNRALQIIALYGPGATTLRPSLHRLRGVRIEPGVFIGTDVIIETSQPQLVSIGSGAVIGIRSVIIAHFRDGDERVQSGEPSVRIEEDVFIGPGVIILPNVTIGYGAVVNAGSIVSRSVPALTMVQGNPARPVARCSVPLGRNTPVKEFYRTLQPIKAKKAASASGNPR